MTARLRAAADLVLHDVAVALGTGAVTIVIPGDNDDWTITELLATDPPVLDLLTDPRRGWTSCDAWAFEPMCPGMVGIEVFDGQTQASLVVRVADVVQEVLMEGERHFGISFPPCPAHPGTHPMWAEERDGEAVWACKVDRHVVVPIGEL